MKPRLTNKNSIFLIILFIVSILFACTNNKEEENHNSSIKQSPNDLLEGVVQAVAYSGFREGQHPDRGDGAVNPSYEEYLRI
ncbi:MAG: hypothetical protein U5K00_06915 [Melioribacteraceae bacterium]|nr:hypothetical protein [Melioribacteraceae bacterium]